MFDRLIARVTSPTVNYTQGHITTPRQAAAAQRVNALRAETGQIIDSLKAIDDTSGDLNDKSPGSIYGIVPGKGSTASCLIGDKDARLNYANGALTYEKKGDREEFHTRKGIEGCAAAFDYGPSTLYTEEWAIVDGPKVSYQKIEYWGD